jgi:hypothetical protein
MMDMDSASLSLACEIRRADAVCILLSQGGVAVYTHAPPCEVRRAYTVYGSATPPCVPYGELKCCVDASAYRGGGWLIPQLVVL